MSIIQALKDLIGYSGNDIDQVFAILSVVVIFYFIYSAFSIIVSMFLRKY